MERGTELWRLDELSSRVERALSVGYRPASSGRVRAVPDRRTIRYYTTLGLLDRPAEMRGRTAYYGQRHLLQLVAIKRLQAEGLSLAQVQQGLTGLDADALAEVAQLPDELPDTETAPRRPDFWAAAPAELDAATTSAAASPPPAPAAAPLAGIELAPEATLLLRCARGDLNTEDLQALQAAAQPLLEALARRGLLSREDR